MQSWHECPRYNVLRDALWEALMGCVGEDVVQQVRALPLEEQLESLLGDRAWGAMDGHAGELIEKYLASLLVARDVTLAPAGLQLVANTALQQFASSVTYLAVTRAISCCSVLSVAVVAISGACCRL